MESAALKTFRRKMVNPLNWRKANRVFLRYHEPDLKNVERTKQLVNDLALELGIPLSAREQTEAAAWLVKQGIDPQSRRDRMSLWKQAKSD